MHVLPAKIEAKGHIGQQVQVMIRSVLVHILGQAPDISLFDLARGWEPPSQPQPTLRSKYMANRPKKVG